MTAFDNIKVNNWPATSNDFEDFLVLKMPLNDNASLTESLPVVAGSKELFPKRTLTNTGVFSLATQTGTSYASGLTIDTSVRDNTPTSNAFDGSTTTKYQWNVSGTSVGDSGTATITFNPPITNVTQLRVHAWLNDNQYDKHGVSINNGTFVYPNIYGGDNQWFDLFHSDFSALGFSSGSTLNKLQFRVEVDMVNQNPPAWIRAIEVNGTILQDAPGGPKKHYDNSAIFDGSTSELTVPADSLFNLSGDFTIEAWTYQDAAVAYGTIIGTGGYHSGSNGGNWIFRRTSATQIAFASYDGQSNEEYVELSATTSLNTWHHIALVRSGTTVQIYVDGVAGGSMTVTKGLEDGANNGLKIGNTGGNSRWNGKFQDIRIYNGVAKYTSNFTPPGAILG